MNHITPQSGIPTNLKRLPWSFVPGTLTVRPSACTSDAGFGSTLAS